MFEQESDRVTREYRSHLTDRILAGTVVATSPRYAHVLFIIVSLRSVVNCGSNDAVKRALDMFTKSLKIVEHYL